MKAQSKILLFSIFVIFSSQAMEESYGKITKIKASSLFAPNKVGKVDLFHDDEGYHVIQDDEIYPVNKHSVDPLLRSLKHKQLKKFQKCGYIHVKKNQDNEFSLVSKVRGNGGGPVTGWILYGATKALLWGGVVTTVPVAVGVGIAMGPVAAPVVVTATPLVATAATVATSGVATSAVVAGVGLMAVGIEAASCTAFAAGTAFPFLP